MKPIRIFRHVACEGPGYLATYLDRTGIPWELVAVDAGEAVPGTLTDVSGLVFMGGPMSVNDPLPWIGAELALIRRASDTGVPVLGHCLGGQLIAKALGGSVGPNAVREIGWHPVERLPDTDAWLEGLPARFTAFHWHGETFSLPAGAVPLLRSAHCENQAFAIGNTLALQCHVELTAPMVREWAALYRDELDDPSPAVQAAGEMLADIEDRVAGQQAAADRLYHRWLRPITD